MRAVLMAAALMLAGVAALCVEPRAQTLDMDAIFRCADATPGGRQTCGTARDLILQNCTSCHVFVPIVMQQFDAGGWQGLIDRHRVRVTQLSNEQIATIQAYLTANFNPDTPPPDLPPELLKMWTSY